MAFELPPLPYAEDALEPDYSARTISFHYGKHHKTYVDTLNKLVAGTDLAEQEPRGRDHGRRRQARTSSRCSTTRPRCGTTRSSGTA